MPNGAGQFNPGPRRHSSQFATFEQTEYVTQGMGAARPTPARNHKLSIRGTRMNNSLSAQLESMNHALNASEVSALLAIRRDTVYAYAKAGVLPSINIGARKTLLRFDPSAVAQWVRDRQSKMQERSAEGAQQ